MVDERKTHCEAGHKRHARTLVKLDLANHVQFDGPKVPDLKFEMQIFEFQKYLNTQGYCPADNDVSTSIFYNGIWEAFETALFVDILRQGDKTGLVLDFGSNLGWYTMIACMLGYTVHAFEVDPDIIRVFTDNMERLGLNDYALFTGWIGRDIDYKPEIAVPNKQIEFVKCDIEGAEPEAVAMMRESFGKGNIKYALLEISPCFNDKYVELVEDLIRWGYTPYQVPNKGFEYFEEYEQKPLETLLAYCKIENPVEYTKEIYQENYLWIKNDLCR